MIIISKECCEMFDRRGIQRATAEKHVCQVARIFIHCESILTQIIYIFLYSHHSQFFSIHIILPRFLI
jgi:hypothetical protein